MTRQPGHVIDDRFSLTHRLGQGGFGEVWAATSPDGEAALKFVERLPGATREIFLNDHLAGVPGVLPVLEVLEDDVDFILVMPRAESSLADRLAENPGPWPEVDVIEFAEEALTALVALAGRDVVHRDLKPGNILRYEDRWHLADFGIARLVDATTSTQTRRDYLSLAYAAPEALRGERPEPRTDMYSLGVVLYELAAGHLPFRGTTEEIVRAHHESVPDTTPFTCGPELARLIGDLLRKAPSSRPTAGQALRRLQARGQPERPRSTALSTALEAVARERAEWEATDAQQAAEAERRKIQLADATALHQEIVSAFRDALSGEQLFSLREVDGAFHAELSGVSLEITGVSPARSLREGTLQIPFEVIATSEIRLSLPVRRGKYRGRAHSLWFCDAQHAEQFAWYETGFGLSGLARQSHDYVPQALPPGPDAAMALSGIMGPHMVTVPFNDIRDDLNGFVSRWLDWLGLGLQGNLRASHETSNPQGSWRR